MTGVLRPIMRRFFVTTQEYRPIEVVFGSRYVSFDEKYSDRGVTKFPEFYGANTGIG